MDSYVEKTAMDKSPQAAAISEGKGVYLTDNRAGTSRLQKKQPDLQGGNNAAPVQRMVSEEEGAAAVAAPAPVVQLPAYLYHATSAGNAATIADNGLEPRSEGGEDGLYLCMSGKESGARTLEGRASDIIFRVARGSLNAGSWYKKGAGAEEWRSREAVPGDIMMYRRNLGTLDQTTWRPTDDRKYL